MGLGQKANMHFLNFFMMIKFIILISNYVWIFILFFRFSEKKTKPWQTFKKSYYVRILNLIFLSIDEKIEGRYVNDGEMLTYASSWEFRTLTARKRWTFSAAISRMLIRDIHYLWLTAIIYRIPNHSCQYPENVLSTRTVPSLFVVRFLFHFLSNQSLKP